LQAGRQLVKFVVSGRDISDVPIGLVQCVDAIDGFGENILQGFEALLATCALVSNFKDHFFSIFEYFGSCAPVIGKRTSRDFVARADQGS